MLGDVFGTGGDKGGVVGVGEGVDRFAGFEEFEGEREDFAFGGGVGDEDGVGEIGDHAVTDGGICGGVLGFGLADFGARSLDRST